jgi:RND family efflux transporter MFP subunit
MDSMSLSGETASPRINDPLSNRTGLWSCLNNPRTTEDYFHSWLALQSSLISACIRSILIIGPPDAASFSPAAKWPEGETDAERLAEISEQVLAQRCGLLTELSPPEDRGVWERGKDAGHYYGAAYPVLIDDKLCGAVAVEVFAGGEEGLKKVMEQLQWGVASLELFFRRRQIREEELFHARLKSAVDLLASVLSEEGYGEASMAFVTGVARQFECDRVSLGFLKRRKISIQAISHSANFDKRMKFNRAVSMAMEEAILQSREIIYPVRPDEEMVVIRNHEEIVHQFGAESILTIPLFAAGKYYGAMTLERRPENPFTPEDVDFCRSIFALAAPALNGKRIQSRPLTYHVGHSLRTQTRKLLGPEHIGRKLMAVLLIGLVIFFSFAAGDYRVTASAALEGAVRRTIAAPYHGYIKEAFARAGDTVQEGKVICTLDERDLRLEKSNLQGQQNQLLKQNQEAMALRDRAKLNIIGAQLDQVMAQINLTGNRLARSNIRAPFDGILVSGDLSQKLGSAVEQGAPLFEIAPLTDYRLILQVNESDIADVAVGQKGKLALSSLQDSFAFTVSKITPITTALEGKNCFRVEAGLDNTSKKLRPGMEGVGKIYIDKRKLISIWTRNLRDWLRLWVWTWWP